MHLIDTALAARKASGRPIRVGMIGAGFMARGVALQLQRYAQGFELVAICNRTLEHAEHAWANAGRARPHRLAHGDHAGFADAAARGEAIVCDDPYLITDAHDIDILLEVTGTVEEAAQVVMRAIERGKHVALMNAELDATVGPLLKRYADRAGVVITNVDGDQPGVIMNLYRFVRGIGVRPVLCGNIKGLQDPYRTPETQREFANQWGQNPVMVTAFADGSKISFEQALVANATGMCVGQRGMYGPTVDTGTPIEQAATWYPDDLAEHPVGIVDYVVGAAPAPGVFVLGTLDDPMQKHYLKLYKLGDGPLYVFYTPYHLCHFEVPNTLARAVLFNDAAIAPDHGPCVDVISLAKSDLASGTVLDGIGGFHVYGECENTATALDEELLPLGLAEGCVLKRAISKDSPIKRSDVDIPQGRLIDTLRDEQDELYRAHTWGHAA